MLRTWGPDTAQASGYSMPCHWEFCQKTAIFKNKTFFSVRSIRPTAVENHSSVGDEPCAAAETHGKILADSSIIHWPSWETCALERDPWHSCEGSTCCLSKTWAATSSLPPRWPRSLRQQLVSLLQHRAGEHSPGRLNNLRFMMLLLWGRVREGAVPSPWDDMCDDLRNPSQPVQYLHLCTCVCVV